MATAGRPQAGDEYAIRLAALEAIPPDVPRKVWLEVALAAKAAGLSEEDFVNWSGQARNFESERDCRSAFKADPQKVGPGTLFHLARTLGGFEIPRRTNGHDEQQAGHRSIASSIWSMCEKATADHAYIVRKGGVADGLRVYPDSAAPYTVAGIDVRGWLVVPSFEGAEISTLQFIAPNGRKLNLPKHEVRGCYIVGPKNDGPMYIVEGIGHAWACWRATGHASVCCFGSANMGKVARSLKERQLVLVPDRGKEADAEALARELGVAIAPMPESARQNYDANDYLQEHGPEALERLLDGAKKPTSDGLKLYTMAELKAGFRGLTWAVKGILTAESLCMLFGASDTFKSFIAIDLALHLAHGLPWLGRKTKQGPVVMVVGEGAGGITQRIMAWHQRRQLDMNQAQMYVLPQPIDLRNDACLVRDAVANLGVAPLLIIVDTMSQTFGDGDEDRAKDVAPYLTEVGLQLRLALRSTVLIVHHTGHNATERPRGSSTLRGNVDCLIGCFRDEQQMLATVECHKQKDAPKFSPLSFALRAEEIGRDEDGDPITSLVAEHIVSQDELISAMARESKGGRGGRNNLFLELAQNGMKESEVRHTFYEQIESSDPEAKRQAYYRARRWAIQEGFVDIAQGIIVRLQTRCQA